MPRVPSASGNPWGHTARRSCVSMHALPAQAIPYRPAELRPDARAVGAGHPGPTARRSRVSMHALSAQTIPYRPPDAKMRP